MNRSTHALVWLMILIAAGAARAAQNRDVPKEFDHVRTLGRALSEFRDDRIHVVAAYYHSQINHHKSPWLLIQLGAMGAGAMKIERSGIELITPGGRVVRLASQSRWAADTRRNTLLLQQASVLRHSVSSYFTPTNGLTGLRFFARPPGMGTVQEVVYLRRSELALGDLLFESPTRVWDEGTHALVIRYDGAEAVLPIVLR